ncbi:MAG: hypothetical protein HY201_04015 [Nitrospirae bacterium]|nr:hypothetical protein [Candidatus Troglogloeales bacterium]MBI3598598.1 hypothetical protein [Candidatus Troglogloeales bacterium]
MKEIRFFTLLLAFGIMTLGVPVRADSMTFQFDRTKPGVTELVESYVRFSINGKQLSTILPPLFYLVTESSEKETVVIAKVGKISKNKALSSTLSNLVGQTPKKVKGSHGKTIFYNPEPDSKMRLSAYTEWKEWLFLAGNPDVISNLLKGAATPQAVVTPESVFFSDGLPKTAAVRFWANNTKGNFTALIRENQQKSLIPLLKDPASLGRFSGLLRLGPGRKISTVATAVPSKPQQRAALKKDMEQMIESSHRLLEIFKVPSVGSVREKGKILDLQLSIDDYLFGQPGLFKPAPGASSPTSS